MKAAPPTADPMRRWLLCLGALNISAVLFLSALFRDRFAEMLKPSSGLETLGAIRFAVVAAIGVGMMALAFRRRDIVRGAILLGAGFLPLATRLIEWGTSQYLKLNDPTELLTGATRVAAMVAFPAAWACSLARRTNPEDPWAARLGTLAGVFLTLAVLANLGITIFYFKSHGLGISDLWGSIPFFLSYLLAIWFGIECARNTFGRENAARLARRALILAAIYVVGNIFLSGISMLAMPDGARKYAERSFIEMVLVWAADVAILLGGAEVLRILFYRERAATLPAP